MGKELQSSVVGALLSVSMLFVEAEQEKTSCCCEMDVRSSLHSSCSFPEAALFVLSVFRFLLGSVWLAPR